MDHNHNRGCVNPGQGRSAGLPFRFAPLIRIMIAKPPRNRSQSPLGIAAIATWSPAWILTNDWFESMPRKFVKHTGILERPVSQVDEVNLAGRAIDRLACNRGLNPDRCAALVFTSPSLVPMPVARKFLDRRSVQREQMHRTARQVCRQSGLKPRKISATHTFCAGFAKALSLVRYKIAPSISLATDEYILVVTSSRISRITDYGCRDTAGLFGDLATVTLICRPDHPDFPVHFDLIDAQVERKPTRRALFDFEQRADVLTPIRNGGRRNEPQRIVFSMDGMGIADTAPRAMASAARSMARRIGVNPEQVQFIVPHQAGSAIVRLAEMKLREAGFDGTVINGLTRNVGNVSSGSIPYALDQMWADLNGTILCPIASVGPPGRPVVAQGCIALRSTESHELAARSAAARSRQGVAGQVPASRCQH